MSPFELVFVSPPKFVFIVCVALQVCFHGVCRLQFSLHGASPFELVFGMCRLKICFPGVCRLLSLFSWRVSPSKFVFHGVSCLKCNSSWRLSPLR